MHSFSIYIYLQDDLKATYRKRYKKHQIHTVNNIGAIEVKEVDIDKFAVKLKISHCKPHADTFQDEARRHLASLKRLEGDDDVELSQLLLNDDRVIFVRGIAGMGKSVLAKQLTLAWATNKLDPKFRLCIMFECRDINHFRSTEGANLKEHEMLEKFIKKKFNYDVGGGDDGVLFVIDGLDELNTDDSTILQLINLNCSKYIGSKIVLTGRPHVESKLDEYGEMGGLQTVEIQGLDDKQIEEYIYKFPFPKGVSVSIDNAKDSSQRYFLILHVPQFLNTFCCVASLLKGNPIHNASQLYCWTIYLLLKQHAPRQSRKRKSISDIFNEYSKELMILGSVCHKLLNGNKIILLKEEIESFLGECRKGTDFIYSLFVDVSQDLITKYQFKHLTIMEFLSAFYICSIKDRIGVIERNLQKGFIDVVIFVCQLLSGYRREGIIKELLKANYEKLEGINVTVFCNSVLNLLQKSKLDKRIILSGSLDIIVSFLHEDVTDKELLLSSVKKLQINKLSLHVENSKKLYEIIEHLSKRCRCNENELQEALKDPVVDWFDVNELDTIKCIKYFQKINTITLNDMKLTLNSARGKIQSFGYGKCKKLSINNCELEQDETEHNIYDSNLDRLTLFKCRLKEPSILVNAVHWAISSPSCKGLELVYVEVEDAWWKELVMTIEEEERNTDGHVTLNWMSIVFCTPEISKDLQERVRWFDKL